MFYNSSQQGATTHLEVVGSLLNEQRWPPRPAGFLGWNEEPGGSWWWCVQPNVHVWFVGGNRRLMVSAVELQVLGFLVSWSWWRSALCTLPSQFSLFFSLWYTKARTRCNCAIIFKTGAPGCFSLCFAPSPKHSCSLIGLFFSSSYVTGLHPREIIGIQDRKQKETSNTNSI